AVMRHKILLVAAFLAGCGGSHGGGGGGTTIGASTSATNNQGPDLIPPEVTVTEPARGAFLPTGPVRVAGHVSDKGSGLAALTVQGVPVAYDTAGNFSTFVTLDPGVAPIKVSATDKAGNRTDLTLSVETGDYLDFNATVPDAICGRINATSFPVMQK